jgi:hypothetical protein
MIKVSELKSILSKKFAWNKARLDCFSRILLSLFAARTVNLKEIATIFGGTSRLSSLYKRIQHFFWEFTFDYTQIARFIFSLFFSTDKPVYLILDRTNWFWGKSKINFLVLAVAYEGIAIPLFWAVLPKAGSSNFSEQQMILKRFIKTFGQRCIAGVLADREFSNGHLFGWLNQQKIAFYIRLKEDSNAWVFRSKCKVKKLFASLNPKEQWVYPNFVNVFGQRCRLTGSRSERGELMIIATNADTVHAVYFYLRRWEIENLFQALKGRGFRFEETRLIEPERIAKLMALLAIGLSWAHKVGEWRSKVQPILWKKFCKQRRPEYSYFRYGFDLIRETIFDAINITKNISQKLLLMLTCQGFQETPS